MIAFRPKLATKLITALLIPLLAVGLLAVLLVGTFSEDATQAEGELEQVRSSIALTEAGVAIRDELSAMTVLPLAGNSLELPRIVTDEALAKAQEVVGNDVSIVRTFQSRINSAREILGDRPATIRRWIADEKAAGQPGIISEQLQTYRSASVAFLQSATFENPAALSGEAAASLATVQLLSNYNVAIQAEYDAFSAFTDLGDSAPVTRVREVTLAVQLAIQQSETAREAIIAIASPELLTELARLGNTQEFTQALEIRAAVSADDGRLPTVDEYRAVSRSISDDLLANSLWSISSSLDVLQFKAVQELESGAEARLGSARLALQSTAGFAIVLALVVILLGFLLYRSIRRPIRNLTKQSRRIAEHTLPEVVTLMRERGVGAKIPTIEPIEAEAKDEIGALVVAFNQMHITAVQLAGEQAAARATVGDMFVNLGRRNQKLLIRLLTHMDSLERKATNADVLEELFKVDHLATRMRRNAESLLVLAGARSTCDFDRPSPLSAILRASLAEVEGYERVNLNIADDMPIEATAIADLSHLVAELVENAVAFSPPGSRVEIAARRGDNCLLLAIADQGIGMTAEELEAANDRIAAAAENTETPSRFLGHYVSGRLAARHGLELKLIPGMPQGLICRIRIPADLIVEEETVRPGISGPIAKTAIPEPPVPTAIPSAISIPAAVVPEAMSPAPDPVPPGLWAPQVDADLAAFEPTSASQPASKADRVLPPRPQHNAPILPGSAPEVVTTAGPTTGALAGSRRRVPAVKRTGTPAVQAEPTRTPVQSPAPSSGLVTSGRRQPGANMPKGIEPTLDVQSEADQARTMDEALMLTRSADTVASALSGLQAAFKRAEDNSWSEPLEKPPESAEGIL